MVGKRLRTRSSIEVRQVEIDGGVGPVGDFEFVSDGARHHVSRREFGQLVILRHEAFELDVAQVRAFATQSFGKEESRRALQV